jgi:hypothetical protein
MTTYTKISTAVAGLLTKKVPTDQSLLINDTRLLHKLN